MTVQTQIQARGKEALHAAIGLGDLAAEKAKKLAGGLRTFDAQKFAATRQRKFTRTYNKLVIARRQVSSAARSVKRAAVAQAEAARTAVEKVG